MLLGAEDYDLLVEMVEILSDSETVEAIRAGLEQLDAGDSVTR